MKPCESCKDFGYTEAFSNGKEIEAGELFARAIPCPKCPAGRVFAEQLQEWHKPIPAGRA